ncbi:N-methyl-L-tryptophan oxidase [Paenibacillus mesophilus]|uniref:N-methyl-L-tryptophan oxidase n=1 Tax=Paenibacillus mesophilus TaxID=2582849 RepID=UPI00110F46CC|nr:N-methyl-L-tryptophan oxidase [Paenibacillus mesophilus]TMV50709.1 N-methyl-L-tryptophan oxidase [Paenibacillus mesophilus]
MARCRYDVIVIGAGAMGMAAGFHAADSGVGTLLIDAFDPPHERGSHHGDTRIIRHAYAMHEAYVPLALRAQTLWEELERETGMELNRKIGLLRVCERGAPSLQLQQMVADAYGIPLERLSAEEMHYRWPGMRFVGNEEGCYEPQGGLLYSEACISAYRKLALSRGAVLRTNEPVLDVSAGAGPVVVTTAQGSYEADRLIVCAGVWSARLLDELGLPIRSIRKPIAWFRTDSPMYDAGTFPAFTYNLPMGEFYGIPGDARSGLKVGRHDRGRPADPDTVDRRFGTYPEDEAELRAFLRDYMPGANGTLVRGSVCMYAMTEDEHFVIDRHPERERIWLACGFSGHGFKFASAVGRMMADLAIKGDTALDRSPFSLERFAKP